MIKRLTVYILWLCLAYGAQGGTEYFVATTGDDDHDGRGPEVAFATIQRGVDALEAGDTLTILPGEYFGSVRREGLGSGERDTTIRAKIAGTVIIRGDVAAPAFEMVVGSRFTYRAQWGSELPVAVVYEQDTLSVLERVVDRSVLESNPGTFYHDEESGWIYLTAPDMGNAAERWYTLSVVPTHGIALRRPQRVMVEGLAVTGFNAAEDLHHREQSLGSVWGILLVGAKRCVIRNCYSYLNGRGIGVSSSGDDAGDNLVDRCVAWANGSQYGSGDSGGITLFTSRRDVVQHSLAFRNAAYGINIRGAGRDGRDPDYQSVVSDSLAWGNFCDFKNKTGFSNHHRFIRCAGPGLWSGTANNTTFSLLGPEVRGDYDASNIHLGAADEIDWQLEFADPLNHDYRLQSTSRFRGAGPDGTDQGPFQFSAEVYFVTEDGDDQSDGLSIGSAWQTLDHALAQIGAGDTLYLLAGTYQLGSAHRLSGTEDYPIALRGRGNDTVVIEGMIDLAGSRHVSVARMIFEDSVRVNDTKAIAFENCTFISSQPLQAVNSSGMRVTHSVFSGAEDVAIAAEGAEALFLQANLFTDKDVAALGLSAPTAVLYSDYNAYANPELVWRVGGKMLTLDQVQHLGSARYASALVPEVKRVDGLLVVANAAAYRVAGPFARPSGHLYYAVEEVETLTVIGPEIHSITDTTVNIEWWTSGPAEVSIEWGEKSGEEFSASRFSNRAGGFSLRGLQPETRYYFRLNLDKPFMAIDSDNEVESTQRSVTIAFTTAATPPEPRTYHVATNGDDSASGLSRANAFATIGHAASVVGPGDTVLVGGGTYHESVRIRATGEEGLPITFRSAPGERVVISGDGRNLDYAFLATDKDFLHIDGFYFEQFQHLSLNVPWSDYMRGRNAAIVLYNSDCSKVTRCFNNGVGRGTSPGLLIAVRCHQLLIQNCVDSRSMGGAIALLDCPDAVIENSVFLRPLITALSPLFNRPDDAVYVRNNIITDNLPKKEHAAVVNLGNIESYRGANNVFFLRSDDPERSLFSIWGGEASLRAAIAYRMPAEMAHGLTFDEYATLSLTDLTDRFGLEIGSLIMDPGFAGNSEVRRVNNAGDPLFGPDMLVGLDGLDFYHLFATAPWVVEQGIGLDPEAFSDFHFSRDD